MKKANDLTDPTVFMDVVNKDLKKKQELLKNKQKSQSEEFDHLHNTHKLEKQLNKSKKGRSGTGANNEVKESRIKEISFNFDNWKKKFTIPYLKGVSEYIQLEDESGMVREYCGAKISNTEDLINTTLLQFPLGAVSTQKDYLTDLQKPVVITIEELQKDLYKFQKDFPKDSLP